MEGRLQRCKQFAPPQEPSVHGGQPNGLVEVWPVELLMTTTANTHQPAEGNLPTVVCVCVCVWCQTLGISEFHWLVKSWQTTNTLSTPQAGVCNLWLLSHIQLFSLFAIVPWNIKTTTKIIRFHIKIVGFLQQNRWNSSAGHEPLSQQRAIQMFLADFSGHCTHLA